jgi:hypothetical protein
MEDGDELNVIREPVNSNVGQLGNNQFTRVKDRATATGERK